MNRLLAGLVCCVACTGAAAAAEELAIGDSVLAHWAKGNAYFAATLVEDRGPAYFVVFEDGDTATVSKLKVRKNDIKVGTAVIARWEDGEYYKGKVAKIVGRALYIHYVDGDKGWAPWSWIAVQ